MTKDEFQRKINEVFDIVGRKTYCCGFVCNALMAVFRNNDHYKKPKIIIDFCYWLQPRDNLNFPICGIDGLHDGWLGLVDNHENRLRRLFFLKFFEEIAISEKLYLKY